MWNPFERRERELDKELRFHVDQQVRDYLDAGLSPEEARRRARTDFGGTEHIKESCRDIRALRGLTDFVRHCRYALRALGRSPGFAAVAVLSLALGIGANTAAFQLLNAVRFRPLPVLDPEEIAEIHIDGGTQGFGNNRMDNALTYPLWEQIRENQESFSGVFAWSHATFAVGEGTDVRSVPAAWISGAGFDVLGVAPLRGRLFTVDDDVPGCANDVVIGDEFWRRQFGGADDAIGSRLTINRTAFTVIGVTPPGFFGMDVGNTFDVALPFCVLGGWAPQYLEARNAFWLKAFGRLGPGQTASSASAWLEAASVGWFETVAPTDYTPTLMALWDSFRLTATSRPNGISSLRDAYGVALWLLFGITGLVQAIACANLANLTLARTLARSREVATRLALGAGRRQVVVQLFTESLLLTLAGAVAGGVLAGVLSNALVRFLNAQNLFAVLDLGTDWRVLAALATTALAACLFFGLSTALFATRETAIAQVASGRRGASTDRRRFSFQGMLIAGQVGVSLVLVAASFLFFESFRNLVTMDAGFRQEGIVYSEVDMDRSRAVAGGLPRVTPEMIEVVRRIPGVEAAATSTHRALAGSRTSLGVRDPRTGEDSFPQFTWISPGYFATMEILVVAGRDFTNFDDADALPVLIVNERFARDYFGTARDAVGRTIRSLEEPGFPETLYRVVGLVANTRYADLREPIRPIAYVPAAQESSDQVPLAIVTRSALPARAIGDAVERALAEVDPGIIYSGTVDLRESVLRGLSRERLLAWLGGFFGGLALTLAAIGLYGVVCYMVSARKREIGIRMALGADRQSVIAMVLGKTARLTLIGCAIGVGLSLALTRLAEGLLFGIAPGDPFVLGAATFVLLGVALAAAYIPGRNAARVDPLETLQNG